MKLTTLFCTLFLLASPGIGLAQSPYSAAVTVNGRGVTYFDIDQRAKMLEAIGTLGDTQKQAATDLLDDRLKEYAGQILGLSVSADELKKGEIDFAKRANLTPEQFVAELAKAGVYPETFTQFVKDGILWRKVVTTKFQGKSFVTDSELDTAMALGSTSLGASVLLSELVLPYDPADPAAKDQTIALLKDIRAGIKSASDFEDAVLTYSAAPSRANSGKVDWTPVGNLPPDVGRTLMTMGVGQVSQPIPLPNAFVLFRLRGVRNNRTIAAQTIAYDYATLTLPGQRDAATLKQATRIAGAVDTCNDLLAEGAKLPENAFRQQVQPIRKVPRRIALELAKLDQNEVSTALDGGKTGNQVMVLMLCGRTNKITEGNRDQVRQALFNQRIEAFGQGYLQELKNDAIIIRK